MSDDLNGPEVIGNPSLDITDFYAFPSPDRPGNLVLIMNVCPRATSQSRFSDFVTYGFRLRPLTRRGACAVPGEAEYFVAVSFGQVTEGSLVQVGEVVTSCGRQANIIVGRPMKQEDLRVFAGLASDPFFMDVEAVRRTELTGKFSFDTATNTVESCDVLTIVVELPLGPIVSAFDGTTLVAAVAESLVELPGSPMRLERVGRPELKNLLLANPSRDPRTSEIELVDLYNREDAFALSPAFRPAFESRLDANLAFIDGLDDRTNWPINDGRHPLRDLLIDDYLILDLTRGFTTGGFLEIERAWQEQRPNSTAGGRWLDDDILDVFLSWLVNGGEWQLGDGVDAPTKAASLVFPFVREPNNCTDLPQPALLRA